MQADEVVLRRAGPADAPALATLIAELSGYFWPSRMAPGLRVLASLSVDALAACVADVRQDYWLAWRGETLVGAAALRDGCHVHHLFVAEACQRQGIAGRLWRTLLGALRRRK